MARVATKLTPAKHGGFTARKRIPANVRDAYARLYGVSSEEWFNSGPVSLALATAKMREWLTKIEGRIANIRAERNGGGQSLTPMQARAHAGEWYRWFTGRHVARNRSAAHWEASLSDYHDDFSAGVWGGSGEPWEEKDPLVVWEESDKAKVCARPVVADHGETAQFLHANGLTLEPSSKDMFLDAVCGDLFAALELLKRRAKGDYGEDPRTIQFPKFERTGDPGITPWMLFERWITEVKPANQTVDRWRGVFLKLQEDFPSAAGMTTDEAQAWSRGLIVSGRAARTVRLIWVTAARTIFEWARGQKLVTNNPFKEVKVTVPRKITTRVDKTFTPSEIKIILKAARAISKPRSKAKAARRWVPWICAYTGARGGEITQLRGVDCIKQDGIFTIKITPEAGTVKTRQPRVVPLHEHLIDQGFMAFVKSSGKGPLFYDEHKAPLISNDVTKPRKARSVKTLQNLAMWVRKLGVTDPEVQPNHAWRHTFKQIGHRAGITERVLDAITGHAPTSTGRAYGAPTLKDKAAGLKQFPRYNAGG